MNVTLAGLSLAASLAQWMAFWASSLEWGCTYGVYIFIGVAFRDADVC